MNPWSIKQMLIAGTIALLVGLIGGAYAAYLFYDPRLELERGRVSQLGERVEEQNTSIGNFKADSDERERHAKAAIQAAKDIAAKAQADAEDLMNIKLPLGSDACTAASALIAKELAK